jgi:hypothetical protein
MITPDWVRWLFYAWLTTGAVCAILIIADIIQGNRQKSAVLHVVWPVAGLLLGPLGVWAYRRYAATKTAHDRGEA